MIPTIPFPHSSSPALQLSHIAPWTRGFHLFEAPQPPESPPLPVKVVEKAPQQRHQHDRTFKKQLLCAACSHHITFEEARIEVNGAHDHTFFNPLGIVYQVGCFSMAGGCSLVGPASDDFSWFPGYRWQIAHCGACGVHLGWSFVGGGFFFALITSRLVEASTSEEKGA